MTYNTGGLAPNVTHEPDDGSDSAIDDACLAIVNALLAARDESAAVGMLTLPRSPAVVTWIVGDSVRLMLPEFAVTVPRNGDAKLMALYALEDLYCAAKAALEHHKATS